MRISSVALVIRGDRHDPLLQQAVVPVKHIEFRITQYPDRFLDGERVTGDAHRRLLIYLLRRCERSCNRNIVSSDHQTAAVSVVEIVFSVIVVPPSIIIPLVDGDVGAIDSIEFAERYLLGKLVDQRDEHVLGNESEVSDEPLKRPPCRRTRESTLSPDVLVVKFSGHWTRPVDIVVEAV
nr:hypothetical protein [Halococcus sediminicola]